MSERTGMPTNRTGLVDGWVHPAFAPAVAHFARLFNPASRGGGALAVRLDGRTVVDVWAGFADRRASRPWTRDTVTICFSTTKGAAAAVVHRLADRGLVDYDAPVATYWKDFAAAGKGAITVRQLLSHQAGLHSAAGLAERSLDLLDHVAMEQALAARAPDPWPGHPGYHALTYGWLLAGLARSVTGLGMADLVRDELATPLGTDGLSIGTPADGLGRFAPPISWAPPVRRTPPAVASFGRRRIPALRKVELLRRFVDALYAPGLDDLLSGPSPLVLDTEMPSVNGVFSAHGLAKLYAAIAGDGSVEGARLLSPATVDALSRVQTYARDAVLGVRPHWRMGYHRIGAQAHAGPDAFGHYGFGGSGGWADRARRLSFGFVTNELRLLQVPPGGDYRIIRLGGLVLRAARILTNAR